MASHLVEHLGDDPISPRARQLPIWRMDELGHLTEHGPLTTDRMALQSTMTRDVGIHRSGQRLRRAQRRLSHLRNEIMETWRSCRPTRDLVELRNLVLAAEEAADELTSGQETPFPEEGPCEAVGEFLEKKHSTLVFFEGSKCCSEAANDR